VFVAIALMPASTAAVKDAAQKLGGAMRGGLRYVFGQRSIASLMVLTLVGGVFGTPPVAFMLPGIVRFELHAGAATLGALTGASGWARWLVRSLSSRSPAEPTRASPCWPVTS
jgi:hypothetical protein